MLRGLFCVCRLRSSVLYFIKFCIQKFIRIITKTTTATTQHFETVFAAVLYRVFRSDGSMGHFKRSQKLTYIFGTFVFRWTHHCGAFGIFVAS